jgi:hypothetical protein
VTEVARLLEEMSKPDYPRSPPCADNLAISLKDRARIKKYLWKLCDSYIKRKTQIH